MTIARRDASLETGLGPGFVTEEEGECLIGGSPFLWTQPYKKLLRQRFPCCPPSCFHPGLDE